MNKSQVESTDINKVLQAVVDYVNNKNAEIKANFPIVTVDNIVDSSMKNEDITVLVDGGIKGVQKHTIPYADLNLRKLPGRPKKVEV